MGQTTSSPFTYLPEPSPERSYSGVGQLFQAKKTAATGKAYPPVSVFVLQNDKDKSEVYAREIKRLRSPDLIKFIDRQVVADKIWLVTESVVPLEAVRETLTFEQLMLAMERTLHALQFVHSHAGLSHNNVCLACIFVHRNADLGGVATFKLGGLENCSNRPSSDGKLSTHPQPPESPAVGKRAPPQQDDSLPIHCRDIWQLGFVLPQLLDNGNAIDAVGQLAQAMRNPDPNMRPTAAKVLEDGLFASDSFLKTFSFLFSFRAHSPAVKRAFFAHLESLLGRSASRDLTESLMPLLTQTDVVVDAEAQAFWGRLFADGARALKSKMDRLECGVTIGDFCDSVVPQLVQLLNSDERARKAAAIVHLPRLLGLLPGKVILAVVLPNIVDCLKDADRGLCCSAMDMCEHLTSQWIARKDEEGLAAVNSQVLLELRSLALDKDPLVRQRALEVVSKLVLLYDKINGMLGIRVLVGSLGDPEPGVVNAALEAIERLKGVMTSVVSVNIVLPGLVPLLLSKHESVRKQTLGLISYLTHLVSQAKDIKQWPDAVPIATPLVGSTRRKNLFVGASAESPAPQRGKKQEKSGADDEDDEEDIGQWGTSWAEGPSSSSAPRSPRTAAPPPPTKAAEFFAGLQLKKEKNTSMTRSTAAIGFAKDGSASNATRQARSKSEEAVLPPEKPEPVVVQGPVKEPVHFVLPSPRKRAELPVKPTVVVPPPISPPVKLRADELNELLKQKSSSEDEAEPEAFGGVILDNESESESGEDDRHDGMLDMVLQSQKMRSDIIATRGGVAAVAPVPETKKKEEKKEEAKPKSKLFDLDSEATAPAKEAGAEADEEGGGWGDFELPST
jgi:hypothetical protein